MQDFLPDTLIVNGVVNEETLLMVLMLPVIGTIMGFARHIIGFKSLGLYAPIILTYAYFQLGLSSEHTKWSDQAWYGLKVGLFLTLLVFITTIITHEVTKRIRLHYSPKIALVLTSVAISLYLVIILADQLDMNTLLKAGFLPIILISTISEQFVSIMAKKDIRTATSLTLTTVLISALSFILIIYKPFQELIIDYPYLLGLTIVINFLIGKFKGLRALEYFRFREILNKE